MVSRVEHRRATLRRIGDAAVELFSASAPESVSVDAVAERAGVSRRTVFRYVDTKEDLVFVHPVLWLELFDEAVTVAGDEEPVDRIRAGVRAVGAAIDEEPEPVRRALEVVRGNPGLQRGGAEVDRRWVDRIAQELADGGEPDFRCRVLAAALMAAIDEALDDWAVGAVGSVVARVDEGVELLGPLLDRAGSPTIDGGMGAPSPAACGGPVTPHDDVTLVRDAIHNPAEPRHFMQLVRSDRSRSASVGGVTVARSTEALVVKEVGRGIYDPVVYFPRADVDMDLLVRTERTTHCPLKGDTEYFDLVVGGERLADAAWSYTSTIEVADPLRDLIAFDAAQVRVD